jgi:hypothetical protein
MTSSANDTTVFTAYATAMAQSFNFGCAGEKYLTRIIGIDAACSTTFRTIAVEVPFLAQRMRVGATAGASKPWAHIVTVAVGGFAVNPVNYPLLPCTISTMENVVVTDVATGAWPANTSHVAITFELVRVQ